MVLITCWLNKLTYSFWADWRGRVGRSGQVKVMRSPGADDSTEVREKWMQHKTSRQCSQMTFDCGCGGEGREKSVGARSQISGVWSRRG